MSSRRAAVVGAGITGLTTAYRLSQKPGWQPTVFEATDRPGGPIQSPRAGEYLLEAGPHTILERNRATSDLIDSLDLTADRLVANPEANKRFIVRKGDLVPVPMSLSEFATSELLSARGKARILKEPFVPPRDDGIDESLASFIERRLGEEVLDYAVGPMVGGIFAGRPRHLSARWAFEKMHRMERESGSLAKGLVGRLFGKVFGSDDGGSGDLISFREGSHQVVEALAERLDGDLEYGRRVVELHRDPRTGWHLHFEDGDPSEPFDTVVWTAPAWELSEIELSGAREIADLELFDEIYHPPVAVVDLGYEAFRVQHELDGFGCLVPEPEPYRILGALFMSTLFPRRAPSGRALLSCFVGGSRHPELVDEPDSTLVELVQNDLRELLGIRGRPEMTHVVRWDRAIPQYEVGYGRFIERFEELEGRFPGLHFTGSFRNGIAVPDLIEAGETMADELTSRPRVTGP